MPFPRNWESSTSESTWFLEQPSVTTFIFVVLLPFVFIFWKLKREIEGFNYQQTFSIPLTANANKLIDRIADITRGYSDSSRVNYLLDFISKNSEYSDDKVTFSNVDKFASPEEFLFYGEGDCEDRSSFLFYALKEILAKPLVIVRYPNEEHLNVAISLELKAQPDFVYKERSYYICEPTTVRGFIPLGKVNLKKTTSYDIIGEFIPDTTDMNKKN